MDTNNNYKNLAGHYDSIVGTQQSLISFVHSLINEKNKSFASIIDIACGTGNMLSSFSDDVSKTGIDISEEMVEIAKNKVKGAEFVVANMKSFSLNKSYDIALCVYDSINHLKDIKQWETAFLNVHKHLNDGGIFVFDINTLEQLESKAAEPVWFKQIENDYMAMKVIKSDGFYVWTIHYFEKINGTYALYKSEIPEISFEVGRIEKILQEMFTSVEIRTSEDLSTGRVFFVCTK